jgi:Zn-dependent peptidase ImmA (M78 family)
MSHSRLNRIENDPDRPVSFDDAMFIADALGIPSAWLIQGSHVRDRVLAAARTGHEENAEGAVDSVMHILELAAQLDDLEPNPKAVSPLPAWSRSKDTTPQEWGKATAIRFREWSGQPSGPISDLPAFIESRGDVFVTIDALPEDVNGLAIADPQTGHAVIAADSTPLWERQRFTLAHELGHLLAGELVVEGVRADGTRSEREVAANEFARNLLVPTSDLVPLSPDSEEGTWTPSEVARVAWEFRVSPAVVAIQLVRAGLAPNSLVQRVSSVSADSWSHIGGWAHERQAMTSAANTRRVPPKLAERAIAAYEAGYIPVATLGRLLDQDPDQIGRDLQMLGITVADAPGRATRAPAYA